MQITGASINEGELKFTSRFWRSVVCLYSLKAQSCFGPEVIPNSFWQTNFVAVQISGTVTVAANCLLNSKYMNCLAISVAILDYIWRKTFNLA